MQKETVAPILAGELIVGVECHPFILPEIHENASSGVILSRELEPYHAVTRAAASMGVFG